MYIYANSKIEILCFEYEKVGINNITFYDIMNFTPVHVLMPNTSANDIQITHSMKKRRGENMKRYGKSQTSPYKKRRVQNTNETNNGTNNLDETDSDYTPSDTPHYDYICPSEKEDDDNILDGKEVHEDSLSYDNKSSRTVDSDVSVNSFPVASTIMAAIQSLPQNKDISMGKLLIYVKKYLEKFPETSQLKHSRIVNGIYDSLDNVSGFRKIRHGHYTYASNPNSRKDTNNYNSSALENTTMLPSNDNESVHDVSNDSDQPVIVQNNSTCATDTVRDNLPETQHEPENRENVHFQTETHHVTVPSTDYDSQKLLLIRIKDLFNEELITKEEYQRAKLNILKKIMEA